MYDYGVGVAIRVGERVMLAPALVEPIICNDPSRNVITEFTYPAETESTPIMDAGMRMRLSELSPHATTRPSSVIANEYCNPAEMATARRWSVAGAWVCR